jgi:ABC-type multidrug transport system ATPase subunit
MIEVSDLHKKFKDLKALDGVNFKVNEGELFGVIGPDGAGKTTLFRLIISLMLPDSGSIRLWGLDPVKDYKKVRQIIGYMPGRFSLYEDLSIQENLQFFATVFGTTIEENYHLIEDIYKQIEPFKDRPAGKLSGGMKQKLALSCALIHRPRLLVLDEPTTGVDAVSRQEFWEMLKKLQKEGITIIVSTPYMDEASLCDRVALLDSGHILDSGTPDSIAKGFGRPLFGVKNGDMHQLLQLCRSFSGIDTVYPFGEWLHITFKEDALNGDVLQKYLLEKGIIDPVVESIEPQIEDCFLRLGKGNGKGE